MARMSVKSAVMVAAIAAALTALVGSAPLLAQGADKAALQRRIEKLKADLEIAKESTLETEATTRKTMRTAQEIPQAAHARLRIPQPGEFQSDERRNAARALEKLRIDTDRQLNRKVDELILDRLRQQ